MTSALSGTYNSARVAMEMVKAEHPEKKIDLLDSLSTGPEMRLLVEKLEELIQDASLDFDAVCAKIREYKTHTKLFYVLQSLHNMAENGRVSKLVAGAVDILGMTIGDLFDPIYIIYTPKTFLLKLGIGLVTGTVAHRCYHIEDETDTGKRRRHGRWRS